MELKYTKGYKYQTDEVYRFSTDLSGIEVVDLSYNCAYVKFISYSFALNEFTIDVGYAWDGPSGPTIDDKKNLRGSLEHDILYQLMRYKILPQSFRKKADKQFLKTAKKDKMNWFRRWYYLKLLRKCASFAAHPKNRKKVYTVGH